MLPKLYRIYFSNQLSQAQLLTLEILVWLVQVHKEIRIERLAVHFPLPIKYESRRLHIQRLLISPAMSVTLIWLPLIENLIKLKFKPGERLYLAIDRTRWKENNLFVLALILGKSGCDRPVGFLRVASAPRRAIPIYWQFIDQKGNSNLIQQKALIRPILKPLNKYKLFLLGDREFHSVDLAKWLGSKKLFFVFRQKKNTFIKQKGQPYQRLDSLEIFPGRKLFLTGIKVRKVKGFTGSSMGIYWKRKYCGKQEEQPWYLLTNLSSLSEAVKAYKKRVGIEAMFKDCKSGCDRPVGFLRVASAPSSGGYNLEGSKAFTERLTRLVLIIAIAYTFSTLKGQSIRVKGQQKYMSRVRNFKNITTKNSNFWIGSYGDVWIISQGFLQDWVGELMRFNPNKLPFYQRGLKAMNIIQQAF